MIAKLLNLAVICLIAGSLNLLAQSTSVATVPIISDEDFVEVSMYYASTGHLVIDGQEYLVTDQTGIRTLSGQEPRLRAGVRVLLEVDPETSRREVPVVRSIVIKDR